MRIRVGTRGSKLALTQTGFVCDVLRSQGFEIELREIKTLGDKKQGTNAAKFGDKKDWIYELELALLGKEIDLAVHSGKDVPGNIEPGTALRPVLRRESPLDVFIGKKDLKKGARISFAEAGSSLFGTASLRRRAQLLSLRPGARIVDHRGNVPTRIEKLDASAELSGIILAESGLVRLGLNAVGYERLPVEEMLPAMNQGILCAQIREDDLKLTEALSKLSDPSTAAAFDAERACVSLLNGDCDSAIGVLAELGSGKLRLRAKVLLPDGTRQTAVDISGNTADALKIGRSAAEALIAKGAPELLEESRRLKKISRGES